MRSLLLANKANRCCAFQLYGSWFYSIICFGGRALPTPIAELSPTVGVIQLFQYPVTPGNVNQIIRGS